MCANSNENQIGIGISFAQREKVSICKISYSSFLFEFLIGITWLLYSSWSEFDDKI